MEIEKGRTARRLNPLVVALSLAAVAFVTVGAFKGVSADDAVNESKESKESKESGSAASPVASVYDITATSLEGKPIALSDYKGKAILVVNTASKCGFTPQYKGLEELHKKYAGEGLVILGFPCNQFGKQEPGEADEIASFCQKNYGVEFQMFEKIDVNGKNAHPLYVYLKKASPSDHGDIRWNFSKFLIDRNGKVIKRYASAASPESLQKDIDATLASKP
jgi:glutathione peroxidase